MTNYDVNWDNHVWQNLTPSKRQPIRYAWLRFLMRPIKEIHAKFIAFKNREIYLSVHTSQKIYLEKILNDEFDLVDRGIYIGLISSIDKLFLYQHAESLPIYLYNKWKTTQPYVIGDYATYGTKVWRAISPSTNQTPFVGSTFWTFHKDRMYVYKKSEYNPKGFIIFVPVALSFDENQMRALVDLYRYAGIYYEIQTY